MNLVGYLRVSSAGQASDGFGLDIQRNAIEAWAEQAGHTVTHWCEDPAVSGTMDAADRPGFAAALLLLEDKSVEGFVAYDMTRIARDLIVQEAALSMLWKNKASVFTTATGIIRPDDPTDATSTMIRQVLGAVAQFERAQVVARMRRGRDEARKAGKHVNGRYHYGEHPQRPDEVPVLARILELRAEGWSAYAISNELNLRQAPTRIEGKRWYPGTVQHILDKHLPID